MLEVGSGRLAWSSVASKRARRSFATGTILPGTPTTVEPLGTARMTTDPDPMRAPSPTEMLPKMQAFVPTTTCFPS